MAERVKEIGDYRFLKSGGGKVYPLSDDPRFARNQSPEGMPGLYTVYPTDIHQSARPLSYMKFGEGKEAGYYGEAMGGFLNKIRRALLLDHRSIVSPLETPEEPHINIQAAKTALNELEQLLGADDLSDLRAWRENFVVPYIAYLNNLIIQVERTGGITEEVRLQAKGIVMNLFDSFGSGGSH